MRTSTKAKRAALARDPLREDLPVPRDPKTATPMAVYFRSSGMNHCIQHELGNGFTSGPIVLRSAPEDFDEITKFEWSGRTVD